MDNRLAWMYLTDPLRYRNKYSIIRRAIGESSISDENSARDFYDVPMGRSWGLSEVVALSDILISIDTCTVLKYCEVRDNVKERKKLFGGL